MVVAGDPRLQRAAILVSQGERNLGSVKNAGGDGRDGQTTTKNQFAQMFTATTCSDRFIDSPCSYISVFFRLVVVVSVQTIFDYLNISCSH